MNTAIIGCFVIGFLTSITGFPIYNFEINKFSITNLLIVVSLCFLWCMIVGKE